MKTGPRKKFLIVMGILALGAAGAWWQRTPLLTWYHVRQLAAADEQDRAVCVKNVVAFEEDAVPALVGCLARNDARACVNIQAALGALLDRWGADDPRSLSLLEALRSRFPQASTPGKAAILQSVAVALRGSSSEQVTRLARELVGTCLSVVEPQPLSRSLHLAAALLEYDHSGATLATVRPLAAQGMSAADAGVRVLAVNLAMQVTRRSDKGLVPRMAPLLRDPAPAVRRAALVALGAERELLADDDLLPLLHDLDPEVRRLCELTLRSRGLTENHLRLARLISDPDPGARLKVLEELTLAPELDPGVWLRRMTHDSDRAIRAAAIRASRAFRVDLRGRIQQMARDDPSETVRQIAQTYLKLPDRPVDD